MFWTVSRYDKRSLNSQLVFTHNVGETTKFASQNGNKGTIKIWDKGPPTQKPTRTVAQFTVFNRHVPDLWSPLPLLYVTIKLFMVQMSQVAVKCQTGSASQLSSIHAHRRLAARYTHTRMCIPTHPVESLLRYEKPRRHDEILTHNQKEKGSHSSKREIVLIQRLNELSGTWNNGTGNMCKSNYLWTVYGKEPIEWYASTK